MPRWTLPLVLVAAVTACGDRRDAPSPPETGDLVGAVRSPRRHTADPGGHPPGRVVDLIEDIVFRYHRDGWTLDSPGSHVTVDQWRAADMGMVWAAVGNGPRGPSDPVADLAVLRRLIAPHPEVRIFSQVAAARKWIAAGNIAVMVLIEGADAVQDRDEAGLLALKEQGVVALGLVNGRSNTLADAAVDPRDPGGLTARGKAFVSRLTGLRMAVDLTHASVATFYDVLTETPAVPVVSHTAVRGLMDHPRNLDDVQMLAVARCGGLVGITFNPEFLAVPAASATMDTVVEHLGWMRGLGVIHAVALGTDFGGIVPMASVPRVGAVGRLRAALRRKGFSPEEIAGLMGGNAWRYLEELASGVTCSGDEGNALRPVSLQCDAVEGRVSGASQVCDARIVEGGAQVAAQARVRLRLQNPNHVVAHLEVFGVPGTPWQVEVQDLDGRVLVRRSMRLDGKGRARTPLPAAGVVRIFLSPTRDTALREAVVWARH